MGRLRKRPEDNLVGWSSAWLFGNKIECKYRKRLLDFFISVLYHDSLSS